MRVYAISDLHLLGGSDKSMSVFGSHWDGHFTRIGEDWRARVAPEDLVLLPGDLSWAMKLEDALEDIAQVAALPGRKVISRGNHDYWWNSISRVRDALPGGMYALQNDALNIENVTLCGTRGWTLPGDDWSRDDERIYRRELKRLELTLDAAKRIAQDRTLVCMLHYPPLTEQQQDTEVTGMLEQAGVKHAVYGHLHGPSLKGAFRGEHNGVTYHQVSCDGTGFQLVEIL